MKAVGQFQSIWLYRPFVDMRKQIAGLSEVVQTEMKLDPFKPGLFVFCNRRRDLLKCIYWDASGFAMWVKKLDQDKFPWPKKANDAVITMTFQQMEWLLDGYNFWNQKPHQKLSYTRVV